MFESLNYRGNFMTKDMVLERGRRAGNVLFAKVLVSMGLVALDILSNENTSDIKEQFFMFAIGVVVSIAVHSILISPLKKDRIGDIRAIYVFLACITVIGLYFTSKDNSSIIATDGILQLAIYGLVIISLYSVGKTGKNFCYCAAILEAISAFIIFSDTEFSFYDFLNSVFSVVYYVFLGLYVESKGIYIEEEKEREREAARVSDEQVYYYRNDYDDLIKLKELMEAGAITPAEYEEKKKQILGI